MKCDELRIENACVYGPDAKVYLAEQVDAAIAELKDKIQMRDFFWEGCGFDKLGFKNSIQVREYIDKLKAENDRMKCELDLWRDGNIIREETLNEIESLKASHYAESVDAGMRERRLKRALWLARAQRANEHYHRYHGKFLCPLEDIPEYVKWKQVERKCRAKAEGYK